MTKKKFKKRKASSYERKPKNLAYKSGKKEQLIVFSFRDLDRNQGQSFQDWEDSGLLSNVCEKLVGLSQLTVGEALQQQIIKIYTKVEFPPQTSFTYPKHVAEGVKWASLHIQGKECVIGYFEEHIFQIVFLDKEHEFWKSEKKNT